MANNKKAARAGTPTASNTALDSCNHIKFDQLTGWFNPAKLQVKIDAYMAGQLALLAVIALLFASGAIL